MSEFDPTSEAAKVTAGAADLADALEALDADFSADGDLISEALRHVGSLRARMDYLGRELASRLIQPAAEVSA
jgi:hypothetical protein